MRLRTIPAARTNRPCAPPGSTSRKAVSTQGDLRSKLPSASCTNDESSGTAPALQRPLPEAKVGGDFARRQLLAEDGADSAEERRRQRGIRSKGRRNGRVISRPAARAWIGPVVVAYDMVHGPAYVLGKVGVLPALHLIAQVRHHARCGIAIRRSARHQQSWSETAARRRPSRAASLRRRGNAPRTFYRDRRTRRRLRRRPPGVVRDPRPMRTRSSSACENDADSSNRLFGRTVSANKPAIVAATSSTGDSGSK